MRHAMKISGWVHPLFRLFGFRRERCFVELDEANLRLSFGSISHSIPLADIASATPRKWPFFYGLGNKLGPDHGVAYVGSYDGVVQLQLSRPHDLQVWGPIRRTDARAVTFALEDRDAFLRDIQAHLD